MTTTQTTLDKLTEELGAYADGVKIGTIKASEAKRIVLGRAMRELTPVQVRVLAGVLSEHARIEHFAEAFDVAKTY